MKILLLIIASIFIFQCSFAQWSTSTNTDSALYVCPGFEPGILSLNDGSCFIAGGLSDYLFVQKLDPQGYKLWFQPVQVFHTPGTDNLGFFTMVSDGLGGLIFVWKDYRGAYVGPDDYYNNAVYMQRVDKDGNTLWQLNGIQIAPVDGGNKEASIVNDGSGGVIVMLGENDFQRHGAAQKERISIHHYNKYGSLTWSFPVDSSSIAFFIYPPGGVARLDTIIQYRMRNDFKYIDMNGIAVNLSKYVPRGSVLNISDSLLFEIKSLPSIKDSIGNDIFVTRVTRISNDLDSMWSTTFEILYEADSNQGYGNIKNPYVSDGNGGLFFLMSCRNSTGQLITQVQNITPQGVRWRNYGLDIHGKSAYTIFSGINKFGILYGDGTAQEYDTTGHPLWPDSVVVFSYSSEAYSRVFASDNNGGCIVAFWTTKGGIYAQHTGRNGKVGVITSVNSISNNSVPLEFSISQNYPNPFNPTTTINYQLSTFSIVSLKVYDILGREVAKLADGMKEAGYYTATFDGSKLSSGIYFVRFTARPQDGSTQFSKTMKMILTK